MIIVIIGQIVNYLKNGLIQIQKLLDSQDVKIVKICQILVSIQVFFKFILILIFFFLVSLNEFAKFYYLENKLILNEK